jgi:ribosomal protein S18 acetylase RimI-like enzyme
MAEVARRSDAGRPRMTDRDARALGWLQGTYVMWEADIAYLLSRLGGGPPPSLSGVQRVLRRWQELGWVGVDRLPGTPRLVWIRHGRPKELAMTKWVHAAGISRARLWLEQLPDLKWLGEFELQPSRYLSRAELLDGMLLVGPELRRVGLEVELTAKAIRRVRERLNTLQTEPSLDSILYLVAPGEGERPIRTALADAQEEIRRKEEAYGSTKPLLPIVIAYMPMSPMDNIPASIKELLACPPKR